MDKLDRNEIKRLCRHSGLLLKNKEVGKLQGELQAFSTYLKKLEDIEISETASMEEHYWTHRNKSPLRKDEVEVFRGRRKLMQNAPEKDQNYIIVPNVVK